MRGYDVTFAKSCHGSEHGNCYLAAPPEWTGSAFGNFKVLEHGW